MKTIRRIFWLHCSILRFVSFMFEISLKLVGWGQPVGSKSMFQGYQFPPASPANKARLAELAASCAEVAKKDDIASLAVLETEINQIVYRLFDLTPEEIALIESCLAS